jgi:pimeloyl-ACP methyl ester carboxylesterase
MILDQTNQTIHRNLPVNYVSHGSGQPVLLAHGMAASLLDWAGLAADLAANGYCACALDLLGHGDSAKPDRPEDYHMQALLDHFSAWVSGLELPAAPVLVGHSLGGWLALQYTLENPDKVRALALIAPLYTEEQLSPILRAARKKPALGARMLQRVPEWLIQTVLGWDPASGRLPAEDRRQIAADYKRASPHILYLTQDFSGLNPGPEQANVPALVIWGEKDLTLDPESFPRLVDALPEARAHPLPGCGHQPHIGQPELVNGIILEFLDRLEPAS